MNFGAVSLWLRAEVWVVGKCKASKFCVGCERSLKAWGAWTNSVALLWGLLDLALSYICHRNSSITLVGVTHFLPPCPLPPHVSHIMRTLPLACPTLNRVNCGRAISREIMTHHYVFFESSTCKSSQIVLHKCL